ncbi:MAG: tetratricopeptide repeat protein [Fidelibacterota bacterium]
MNKSKDNEAPGNLVPLEVLSLFPVLGDGPSQKELISKVSIDDYLEKTEDVYRLNLVTPEGAIDDLSGIFELDSPDQRGIAWACLGYHHTFNGNYQKAFTAFSLALEKNLSADARAYAYAEVSDLFRKLGYVRESLSLLHAAANLTKNEKLRWRIQTYVGLSQKGTSPESALKLLTECENHYRSTGEYFRVGMILRHRASILIHMNDLDKAEEYLNEALDIASEYGLTKHQISATNDLGWVWVKKGELDRARSLFKELILDDLPVYNMSLALQNLGYLEFESKRYRKAVDYHIQSLQLTTRYEMRDMAFEDYFKLGLCHEKLGDVGLADHFYSAGYAELMKEVQIGLPLVGYREKLLAFYVEFLGRNQKIPRVDVQEEVFGFAMDKTLREIRRIFHTSLLNLHLERTKNAPQMCRQLDIDTRTYFLYQKKLGLKRGEARKPVVIDNPHFEHYLRYLIPLKWKEANKKFEEDLFSYLVTKYQNNKTRIAKALDVSYAQVVMKTKQKLR